MFYKHELDFLKQTFAKCRLKTLLATEAEVLKEKSETPISKIESRQIAIIKEHLLKAQPNTVYKLKDSYGCRFLFLLLPKNEEKQFLIVGPYFSGDQSIEELLTDKKQQEADELKRFYAEVPKLRDVSLAFAMLDSFCEIVFADGDNFCVVDIETESQLAPSPLIAPENHSVERTEQNRELMERRYNYENELMHAVSRGLSHKALQLLSGFSQFSFERRSEDPVRDIKNYSIIMNTLLRKAAENGGVHPLYLDSVSSDFAKRIESYKTGDEIEQLLGEMFSSYCRLVRKHSMKDLSPLVQRTIIQIDTDLSADLSLAALSEAQKVSSSYLSALFHREMGQTLTDHVNEKRIKLAKKLLKTTALQVQVIAQQCGILDVHYFSRIFKKYTGKTPKEYRES